MIDLKMPCRLPRNLTEENYIDKLGIFSMPMKDRKLLNRGVKWCFLAAYGPEPAEVPFIEKGGLETGDFVNVVDGVINFEELPDRWGSLTFQIFCEKHGRWHTHAHGFQPGDNPKIDECRRAAHCPLLNSGRGYVIRDKTLSALRYWASCERELKLRKNMEKFLDFSGITLTNGLSTEIDPNIIRRAMQQYARLKNLDLRKNKDWVAAYTVVLDAADKYKKHLWKKQQRREKRKSQVAYKQH